MITLKENEHEISVITLVILYSTVDYIDHTTEDHIKKIKYS